MHKNLIFIRFIIILLACCDVIFESDVNAVDIMQEMCRNVLKHHQVDPRVRDALTMGKLTPQSSSLCREEVLARCGIDLSAFLAERERLGKSYKQVLEEIRSFNSSLCLKMNFGIPLSQLGTPHLIRYHILMPHSAIRQERRTPPHAGGLHPALRERGRAIPSSHIVPKIQGRLDHDTSPIKIRPTMGGAGHVVAAPKGNSTMGIIMPLYTVGIVLFFLYTMSKVLRKSSGSEIISNPYSNAEAEREFQKMVFNPEVFTKAMSGGTKYFQKERTPSPIRPAPTIEELNEQAAGDIEIDQLRRRLVETEAAMERIVVRMGNLSRSVMHISSPQPECKDEELCDKKYELEDIDDSHGEVKVVGMEMTTSCEGGQKCSRPTTPTFPAHNSHIEREETPPVPIYLEGALPSQCELLVTDSKTQEVKEEESVEAPVILSGKMTLSLISLDQIAPEDEVVTKITKRNDGPGSGKDESKRLSKKDSDTRISVKKESEDDDKIQVKKVDEYKDNAAPGGKEEEEEENEKDDNSEGEIDNRKATLFLHNSDEDDAEEVDKFNEALKETEEVEEMVK
ncbi:uncharacterized protein LOC117175986 isoform X2 [Belonocnema kinseyi]|uniref:uncharacterized protein LOC117175986 isoform X2 n=1 Tax=Belonocnema kinseyi TaxID=2817044 RepID=UPI00143DDFE9|nr:uncharacterized protein LOC117175986 isoform X2 [Belonocnema kinseyi]